MNYQKEFGFNPEAVSTFDGLLTMDEIIRTVQLALTRADVGSDRFTAHNTMLSILQNPSKTAAELDELLLGERAKWLGWSRLKGISDDDQDFYYGVYATMYNVGEWVHNLVVEEEKQHGSL